jgi:hypothetical protein
MHAVYLCHFCPFSPSFDREPQKSYYIFLPSIVSPYSSNPLQSCTWARTLKSLYLLRVPLQSSCTLQPLKVSTHQARPYRVSIWYTHLCSPYTIKSARVSAYLLPPLQSPNTLRTYAVSIHLANLKSLHHVTQPYAVSIVPESLCSLRMKKSGKVFAYSFALAVSICSMYLCGLGVTFAPLRLALTIGERAVSGSILYIFSTAGRCPNQWAVHCRHIRRSHRRYTQIYSRRV